MIKERYCSFEVAKLLKEKGFDVKCDYYYFPENKGMRSGYKEFCHKNHNEEKEKYSAPTHQMAMDWLRSEGLHIEIHALCRIGEDGEKHFYKYHSKIDVFVGDLMLVDEWHHNEGDSEDYEECVENAIRLCVTKLMNEE